jgi:AcrR family transcriptional regulator
MSEPSRPDRARRQILDAAVALLTKDAGASLAEIATAAGVGRTTVHRYFPSREALLTALGLEAVARVSAAIEDASPGEGPATQVLARLVARVMPLAGELRYLELGPDVWNTPELTAAWYPVQDVIDGVVARGQREGDLRPDLPVALVADLLAGALWAVGESVAEGRVASRDAVPGVVAIVLDGAATRRGTS